MKFTFFGICFVFFDALGFFMLYFKYSHGQSCIGCHVKSFDDVMSPEVCQKPLRSLCIPVCIFQCYNQGQTFFTPNLTIKVLLKVHREWCVKPQWLLLCSSFKLSFNHTLAALLFCCTVFLSWFRLTDAFEVLPHSRNNCKCFRFNQIPIGGVQ